MGYNIWFEGRFFLNHPLAKEHRSYLQDFSEVRHMTWNAELLEQMEDDPTRLAVGLPIGEEGRYFTSQAGSPSRSCNRRDIVLLNEDVDEGCNFMTAGFHLSI